MSILKRLQEAKEIEGKRIFGVIAGPRLGGKTTLAGTLPGRTLLLQAAVLESGSGSAKQLATKNGNELYVATFTTVDELLGILKELRSDTDFDNVYLDGVSAVSEMKYNEPANANMRKNKTGIWDAFRAIADASKDVLRSAKELTYPELTTKPKNVFVTCALRVESKDGVVDISLEAKGNVATSEVTKLGEAVLTVLPPVKTEQGETGHRLISKSDGTWPGRVDGILAEDNPGLIEPADLSKVLELVSSK